MVQNIYDWILSKLQRRCTHPDDMVAADILEGAAFAERSLQDSLTVAFCRRCGSYSIRWNRNQKPSWHSPDPLLWRGMTRSPWKY